jgi:hypothetical protein
MPRAIDAPPWKLQIARETLHPGAEAVYKEIEEDAARICAELGCPNVHLAMESVSGPTEVWWLTPYESEADKQRVADGYSTNDALMTALLELPRRKLGLVGPATIDILAGYRSDLSDSRFWRIRGTRFFVVTVTKGILPIAGAVFEAADGTRFVFRPASTREEADRLAGDVAPQATTIFAVRPYWGMPAKEWIAADPDFWSPNPMASIA